MTGGLDYLGPPGAGAARRQRDLILNAALEILREHGFEALTVAQIATHSGVSVRTVNSLFEDPRECIAAAFEDAVTVIEACVLACHRRAREDPLEGTRDGLTATLVFLDEQPELAWLCLVYGPACPQLLLRCRELTDKLTQAIDRALLPAAIGEPPPWTAHTVVGAVLGAVRARLIDGPGRLSTMSGQLMGMIVLPYLGPDAAQEELMRRTQ